MAILEAAGKWVYALVKRQCSPELVAKLDCNNVATHTCRKMAWHSYKQVVKKEKKTEKCFHCNRTGHWKRDCPMKTYEAGVANLNINKEEETQMEPKRWRKLSGLYNAHFCNNLGKS